MALLSQPSDYIAQIRGGQSNMWFRDLVPWNLPSLWHKQKWENYETCAHLGVEDTG